MPDTDNTGERRRDYIKMSERLVRIESRLEDIHQYTDELRRTIHGRNGTPGWLTRLDRIEQREENRKWHFRLMWAAVIAGVAEHVRKIFM